MVASIIEMASKLGKEERARVDPLPILALACAKAAKDKRIGTEDANEIYAAYLGHKDLAYAREVAPGFRQNASKLRQVIAAADPDLVERCIALQQKASRERTTTPLYALIVNACRTKNNTKRRVGDNTIKSMM